MQDAIASRSPLLGLRFEPRFEAAMTAEGDFKPGSEYGSSVRRGCGTKAIQFQPVMR
jgi:hypothetical protein